MEKLVLFCKSYRQDIHRAHALAVSVAQFNRDRLPFYMSVPESDMAMFRARLADLPVTLIEDRDIIAATTIAPTKVATLSGGLAQQVIKAQFWRMAVAENTLTLDSDCRFLRPFERAEFFTSDGQLYSLLHESKELLHFAACHNMPKVAQHFVEDRRKIMALFERTGRCYDFGPAPLLWSSAVWRALDQQFLAPRGMDFCDAIMQFPSEILWYGEALLRFKPIPLWPIEPLFRCYHYREQYRAAQRDGETENAIAQNYLGVVYQSNWHRALDFESRWARRWRRLWGRHERPRAASGNKS